MNKNEIEKKMKRTYRWKFEILPLVILMIPLIFTIGLFSFNESLILDSISILNFYIYIIFIWFIIYIIVEFILWFKTRNPGHQLQFLGAILIVIFPILIFAVNILDIPTWTYLENKQIRFIMDIISGILVFSLGLGITFMLIGYYNKEYKASETEMYRNIIVREGENIDEMTDGYSSRISTRNYNEISQISKQKLSALAENYGKTMAREGLLIDWNVKGNKVMFYPMPYTGIGTFKLHILITQLWMLF